MSFLIANVAFHFQKVEIVILINWVLYQIKQMHCFWVSFSFLSKLIMLQKQKMCEISWLDGILSGFLTEKSNFSKNVIFLQIFYVCSCFSMEHCCFSFYNKEKFSSRISFNYYVVINHMGRWLKNKRDFTQKLYLEIFKKRNIFKNSAIQVKHQFRAQIFIQDFHDFVFLYLYLIFLIMNVLQIIPHFWPNFFWNVFIDEKLIHILHFLIVLSSLHIESIYNLTYVSNGVCKYSTGNKYGEYSI